MKSFGNEFEATGSSIGDRESYNTVPRINNNRATASSAKFFVFLEVIDIDFT
jgi:hypothetical protein